MQRRVFNNEVIDFYSSGFKSKIVEIYPGEDKKIKEKPNGCNSYETVRLVRVKLPGEENKVLIKSLLDEKNITQNYLNHSIFRDGRWKLFMTS